MDGVHDLGGMDNFGPIVREDDEPVFHADWERAVFSNFIAIVGAGYFKVDEIRRTTELIPPAEYLAMSYYERWFRTLCNLLVEKGALSVEELEQGRSLGESETVLPALPVSGVTALTQHPVPASLDTGPAAKYAPGDAVRAKVMFPWHHTRLPRYVRGKSGTVVKSHGIFLLPDTNAHGGPDKPQHNYSVRFAARELWGEDASPNDALYIDLFDDYLEPA